MGGFHGLEGEEMGRHFWANGTNFFVIKQIWGI